MLYPTYDTPPARAVLVVWGPEDELDEHLEPYAWCDGTADDEASIIGELLEGAPGGTQVSVDREARRWRVRIDEPPEARG